MTKSKSACTSSDGNIMFFSQSIRATGKTDDPKDILKAIDETFNPNLFSTMMNRVVSFFGLKRTGLPAVEDANKRSKEVRE